MNPDDDDKNTVPESVHLEEVEPEESEDSGPAVGGSLEGLPGDNDEASSSSQGSTTDKSEEKPKSAKKDGKSLFDKVKSFIKRFDIYLLVFILVTVLALIIAGIALNKNNNNKTPSSNAQSLSQSALSQLNSNDTQVGNSNQTLNIESNSIFAGNVLVKGGLQVAGAVTIAGGINLSTISVSGTSTLNQVNASSITVSGNSSINGSLAVKQNLSVGGTGSFGGNLSAPLLAVSTLQVNGDIQVSHHITTSGSIPRSTNGNLGSGGTASVNGSDTAGTINIGVGSGVSGQDCLVTITFSQAYGSTPHVEVTPVGSAAGNINFYINQTSSSFTVCGDNVSTGSYAFNYFVID